MDKGKIKILMLSAEVAPIAKVGGLGDVVGALPKDLIKLNTDIRIVLPFYGLIDIKKYKIKKVFDRIVVPVERKKDAISLWQTTLPGTNIIVYLIKHKYFDGKEVYAGERIQKGNKYSRGISDIKRFAFFTRAALEATKTLNFIPDVIHAHDWHVALTAEFLKTEKKSPLKNTKTIYTIHNLANQGIVGPEIIGFSEIDSSLPIIKADLKNGDINFMVQGILASGIVNTVSPTYAKEILTHDEGAGLENILKKRKKDLYGILNGIDTEFFNPVDDKFISKKYSLKTLDEKIKNKLALQKKLGLPKDENIALAGLVSRFVWQKGIELVTEEFSRLNCQFVFLGTGEKKYESYLKALEKKYPKKFKVILGFDEKLAHQIYAGSDMFLMPSRFEPCGLGQMIAMCYGTVPVVRATGGLADTVRGVEGRKSKVESNKETGFVFKKFDSISFYDSLEQALDVYYNKLKAWRMLQINGMKKDFSWNKSAKEYLKLYKKLI